MPMTVKTRETPLPGVLEVQAGVARDSRGYFSEIYSERMFAEAGIAERFVQDNVSLSARGTLRGLHYQIEPHATGKLVRALTGALFDVAVDLRKGSPTFGRWHGAVLSEENLLALWVPAGFAHGFLALEDGTRVHYKCTTIHTPEAERAILYRDPRIGIDWPIEPTILSPKDAAAPTLEEAEHNFEYRG